MPQEIERLLAFGWDGIVSALLQQERSKDEAIMGELSDCMRRADDAPSADLTPMDLFTLILTLNAFGEACSRQFASLGAAYRQLVEMQSADPSRGRYLVALFGAGNSILEHVDLPGIRSRLVDRFDEAVDAARRDPELLGLLSATSFLLHRADQDLTWVDRVIDAARQTLEQPVDDATFDEPIRCRKVRILSDTLAGRDALTDHNDDAEDLRTAIVLLRSLDSSAAAVEAERSLIGRLAALFDATGELDALDEALQRSRDMADDPPSIAQLRVRAELWERRYSATDELGDLDAALACIDAAAAGAAAADGSLEAVAGVRERLHRTRFARSRNLADLDAALDAGEEVLALRPRVPGTWDRGANNLALLWIRRDEHTGEIRSLRRAIELGEQALACCHPDDPANRAIYQRNLSRWHAVLADRTGDAAARTRSLELAQTVTAEAAPADGSNAQNQLALANRLIARHRSNGNRDDLDRALRLLDVDRDESPELPEEIRPSWLTSLALALEARWNLDHDADDLDRSISLLRSTVDPHQGRPRDNDAIRLGNLGMYLGERFNLSGDRRDLDDAIHYTRAAIAGFPPGSERSIGYNGNLAARLVTRFELTGDETLAIEAVHLMRDVLAATTTADTRYPMRLGNLGGVLAMVAHRYGIDGDASGALQAATEAVALLTTAVDIANPATVVATMHTANLAQARFERFVARQATGSSTADDDLDAVIDALEVAGRLDLSPNNGADVGADLARALEIRSGGRATHPDLAEARAQITASVDRTPPTHPRYGERVAVRERLTRGDPDVR